MKRILPMLALSCCLCSGHAQSGILASSRYINWSGAGLPATLPDGETTANPWTPPVRTQCVTSACNTVSGGTVTAASINSALASAPAGTYVLMPAGSFTINNADIYLFSANGGSSTVTGSGGVTLRGSGPQSTSLSLTGTSAIEYSISWSNEYCTWQTGLSAGSTTLTANGCSVAPVVGELLDLIQCDTGYTGSIVSSQLNCSTGSSADNGALYICGDNNACQTDSDTSPNAHQNQFVYAASVVNSSGTYTIGITPSIYMPNWSTGQTATVEWVTSSNANNTPTSQGLSLEDMTIYENGSIEFAVSMNQTYASWAKGVRFLGAGGATITSMLNIVSAKNCLIMNNYYFSNLALDNNIPTPTEIGPASDNLMLNNISVSGVPWEGTGGNEGNVVAYNYGRDTLSSSIQYPQFDHHAGSAFALWEGNEWSSGLDDNTWGTHTLDTWFREYLAGWESPFVPSTNNPKGLQFDKYQRFANMVGNVIGPGSTGATISTYQGTTSGGSGFIYSFNSGDSMVLASSLRWGNCDTVTNTCRFQSSEIPTSIAPNGYCTASVTPYSCCTGSATGTCSASAWQNSVPGNNNLPCSFFLASYTGTTCTPKYSGGSGLSFWKVCTNWTTFPTACATTTTQPFPPAGPDLVSGPYVNGTAYDVPAAIAFKNLPVDTSYQNSYTITGSSFSGGIVTLTVSGLPNPSNHIMGPMQISGGNCATSGAGTATGSEVYITASTSTTVSYARASNPGTCTGTMLFPDVRQFDERVFESDPASTTAATAAGVSMSGVTLN